ncbi:3-phosphoglycerate dehydrogenase [Philodulcilactobacillus myokoensis]|uniref:3-phosphoglycerate dehydrogenase n=1 Tax=Philodulcilactobacillus myokoensis TaxID=2929573 RepID=A0A9W6B1Q7_9LACO|nr:phosphoglycerate dehydrogenase [Philodulcilactobacillus myokoensis]GLB46514.1 3-phosphoglycerate dehydrogenase [Philodulcilactobacillus myokoensis]
MANKVLVPQIAVPYVKDDLAKHHLKMISTSNAQKADELLSKGKDAVAVMLLGAPFTKDMIDQMPNLKVISRFGVGYDNVDYRYAAKKGIKVTNTPGANAASVAEAAVTDILILSKHSYSISKAMREGDNDYVAKHPTNELAGKTVGIIGFGHIGRMVAKMLSGFNVNVLIWNRHPKQSQYGKFVDWDTLLKQSDFITLHVPATPDTIHSISTNEFKMMKDSAHIVNFARGSVIDQKALVEALKSGEIAGAGLDVYEKEPLPEDSELRKLPNVYLTPHNAGHSYEAIERMSTRAASEMERVINNEQPKWQIN